MASTSNIPNAGFGLFAEEKAYEKGDIICIYAGKLVSREEARQNPMYVVELNDSNVLILDIISRIIDRNLMRTKYGIYRICMIVYYLKQSDC